MIFSRSPLPLIAILGFAFTLFFSSAHSDAQELTYNKDVMPILQKHCLSCHHKGGVEPQSFESYAEMRPWIRSTNKTVRERSMPPWQADPTVGKWKNDGRLTDDEAKMLMTWASAKGPEGNPADAPPKMDFTRPWKLGDPDKVAEVAAPFAVPAQGGDLYHAVALKWDSSADAWLSGVELAPGKIEVVQDMTLSIVPADAAKGLDDPGSKAFESGFAKDGRRDIAVWNKGMTLPQLYPEGTGVLIPKGSSLVLRVHYKTNGEAASDSSKAGLHISKATPPKEVKTLVVENTAFEIPANSNDFKVTAEQPLAKPIRLLSVLPLMNYLGKQLELTAMPAEGAAQPILKINDYNFELQTLFATAEPLALTAGTKLTVTAVYDNSKDNPHNPNTTVQKVTHGPAPQGESCGVILYYTEP